MASIRDLKDRLRKAVVQLETDLPLIAEQMASAAKALAERQIIEVGFGANYSTNELPLFFFYEKEINAGGLRAVANAKKEKRGLSWSGFKEAQGLPVDHVTLSYSNEMWRGMVVLQVIRRGEQYIARLGHNNFAGQQKMNYNFIRYQDFVMKGLTDEGKNTLGKFSINKVIESVKKSGL